MPWHPHCEDPTCHYRCARPGCQNPGAHFLVKSHFESGVYVGLHTYACTVPVSLARQAADELRPGMDPDEVAIARRVLLEALTRLETLETKRPVIFRESA